MMEILLNVAAVFQQQRDQNKLYHFVMRLRWKFEGLCGHILYHCPLPSLIATVAEFILKRHVLECSHLRLLIGHLHCLLSP